MQNLISACGQRTRGGNGRLWIDENRWSPGAGLHSREWTLTSQDFVNTPTFQQVLWKHRPVISILGLTKVLFNSWKLRFNGESQHSSDTRSRLQRAPRDTSFPRRCGSGSASQVAFSSTWGACSWIPAWHSNVAVSGRRDCQAVHHYRGSSPPSLARLVDVYLHKRLALPHTPSLRMSESPDKVLNSPTVKLQT